MIIEYFAISTCLVINKHFWCESLQGSTRVSYQAGKGGRRGCCIVGVVERPKSDLLNILRTQILVCSLVHYRTELTALHEYVFFLMTHEGSHREAFMDFKPSSTFSTGWVLEVV